MSGVFAFQSNWCGREARFKPLQIFGRIDIRQLVTVKNIECPHAVRMPPDDRLTAHALLGLTQEIARSNPVPAYARLIGMRADAKPLLAELKKRAALPIVSDPVKLKENEIFRLECRATDLRALQCDKKEDRRSSQIA